MKQTLCVISCISVVSVGGAIAQDGPAELPPEDYAGRQYIDSQGCIFLREKNGDAVIWVPRTVGNNQNMCGFAPTFPALVPLEEEPAAPVVVEAEAPTVVAT